MYCHITSTSVEISDAIELTLRSCQQVLVRLSSVLSDSSELLCDLSLTQEQDWCQESLVCFFAAPKNIGYWTAKCFGKGCTLSLLDVFGLANHGRQSASAPNGIIAWGTAP